MFSKVKHHTGLSVIRHCNKTLRDLSYVQMFPHFDRGEINWLDVIWEGTHLTTEQYALCYKHCDCRDGIILRHRSGEGYTKRACVTSVIPKGKKFSTIRTDSLPSSILCSLTNISQCHYCSVLLRGYDYYYTVCCMSDQHVDRLLNKEEAVEGNLSRREV